MLTLESVTRFDPDRDRLFLEGKEKTSRAHSAGWKVKLWFRVVHTMSQTPFCTEKKCVDRQKSKELALWRRQIAFGNCHADVNYSKPLADHDRAHYKVFKGKQRTSEPLTVVALRSRHVLFLWMNLPNKQYDNICLRLHKGKSGCGRYQE